MAILTVLSLDTTGKTVTYAVRSVTISVAKPAVDPPLIWRCRWLAFNLL